jgi:mono/diheme cytochrome c family protein
MKKILLIAAALVALPAATQAAGNHDAVLAALTKAAKAADPGFSGFSAKAGQDFFLASHDVKPDTPSCSTCHTRNPAAMGQTRAGKAIDPMAVSANPDRFTDLAKVEKWFGRNCDTVLGRECTPQEKGNFATYMMSQ